jgi:hypothetical protein
VDREDRAEIASIHNVTLVLLIKMEKISWNLSSFSNSEINFISVEYSKAYKSNLWTSFSAILRKVKM